MTRPATGKRELILETASRMIWNGSYGSVSADQVCEAAGVNKGVFYHYFKSKEALLLATLDHNWAFSEQLIRGVWQDCATDAPLSRLMAAVNTVFEVQWSACETGGGVPGCPFGNLVVEMSGRSPAVDAKLKEIFDLNKALFKPVLAELAGDSGADADFMALKLITCMQGILVVTKAYNDVEMSKRLAGEIPAFLKAEVNG